MPQSKDTPRGGLGGTEALVSEGAKCKLCFCAVLSSPHSLSEPQFPHLRNGNANGLLPGIGGESGWELPGTQQMLLESPGHN